MASTVQIKRSTTPGAAPSTLADGELAINRADGKVFWKDSANAIQSFTFAAYATAASPTFTGVVTVPAGSAASPGVVSSTGTADTGLWFPGADQVSISTAGVARLRVDATGAVAIGGATATNAALYVRNTLDSASTRYGVLTSPTIAAASTSSVNVAYSSATLEAAAAIGTLTTFTAANVSLGAGATLTNQYAFYCGALTSATNNYAYYGGVASGTGRFNAYMAGTAANYFAGSVGIGTTGPTSPLHVVGTVDCDGLIIGTTTASATGIALLGAADAAAGRTTLSAAAATHTHDAADVVSGVLSTARLGTGSATSSTYLRGDGAWSTISGGGIVEAATPASFPATGAAATLYLATDTSRLYRWVDATTKYVEVGPVGGGDTALWSLFLPPAPTSVAGTAGNAQVSLTWTAPTVAVQTPVQDYVVQYSSNSGSTWTTFSDGTSTATSAVVASLTNSTAYVFRVAAVNAVGQGAWSTASASVTPVSGDPLFGYVSLLLHADGTGATFTDSSKYVSTITAGGSVTQSATHSKFGGKSAYFSTSSDSLSFPDVALGTGDFTVEMFFKTNSSVQYAQLIGNETSGGFSGFSMLINNNSSTGGQIAVYRAGALVVQSSSGDWSDDAWHHVALVRSGTTVTLWIDGTSYGTGTDANSYSGDPYYIGRNNVFTPRNLVGYIDEVRISKYARYSAPFTPSTSAFQEAIPGSDVWFPETTLLLHCDGSTGSTTITDNSGTPKTVTVNGNAAISTTQSKWGGASVYCDGAGDWLNCGTHALTGDFAIEAWIYPTSIQSGYVTLWAHRSTTGGYGGACLVSNNGALEYFVANSAGTTWDITGFSSGLSLTANQWQHIVLTRSGTTLRAYRNGTGGTSTTSSGTIGTNGQMSFMAGASGGGQEVAGYIDDIRITLGSARGYTGASITVPTAAFPNS